MRVFGRLLRYTWPYRWQLVLALLLSVAGVVVELLRPWPMKVVVDYVLTNRSIPPGFRELVARIPGADSQRGLLAWSVAALVLIVIVAAVFSLAAMFVTIRLSQRLVYDLSLDVFAKLQRQSLAYHGEHPLGDLLQRVSTDVFAVYSAVSGVVIPVVVSILSLGGMFLIMAKLDTTLALFSLAVVPLLALSLGLFSRPMDTTATRQYAAQGALLTLAEQSLSNIKVIQGFARELFIQRRIEASAEGLSDAYNKAVRVSAAYQQVITAITGLGTAVILGAGGWRVLSGSLSLGDLLVFVGYLTALYGPVSALTVSVGTAIQIIARGRRVFEVLDSEEDVKEQPGATKLSHVRGEIQFEDVTFGYRNHGDDQPGNAVLQHISFTARPGQVTAIVGATGAGKSSLVSLLSRFYDPWKGRITLDGHDLRGVTLQSLRENIALVLQDPFLFPMSIAENIAFGRPDASRAAIVEAARIARAHEFIERLPDGYDTVLAEKGTSLSGGQRQRIAIARAIIKDAPIIVFDEPTSSVDARTEAQIFEAISELMNGRTTFIISHRMSTIRRSDQIIALEHGRIVEQGSHEDLLAHDGIYARLVRHQHIAMA